MNLRVLDDGRQELGMGRDLVTLQKQFGTAAELTFRDSTHEFERDDVQGWDVGATRPKASSSPRAPAADRHSALACEEDRVAPPHAGKPGPHTGKGWCACCAAS